MPDNHSPDEVAGFLAGLELVPPGLVAAQNWRGGWHDVPDDGAGPGLRAGPCVARQARRGDGRRYEKVTGLRPFATPCAIPPSVRLLTGSAAVRAAQGREMPMSYQQPPEDPQQTWPFTPFQQGQPSSAPPQGRYPGYQQQPYNGQGAVQPAPPYQPGPAGQGAHPPQAALPATGPRHAAGKQYGLNSAESSGTSSAASVSARRTSRRSRARRPRARSSASCSSGGQGPGRSYSLNGMESFWYALMCLSFGAGYFAKVSAKKALWELVGMVQSSPGEYAGAIGRALAGNAPGMAPHRHGY